MGSRRLQTSLLLIALASYFMMATNASEESSPTCTLCLSPLKPNDPSQGACLDFDQSGTTDVSTHFIGENGHIVGGFRYVRLTDCGDCTLTAYSSPGEKGMSAMIDGGQAYTHLNFCARSFSITCDFDGDNGGPAT